MRAASTALAFALLVLGASVARGTENPEALIRAAVTDVLAAYDAGKDRLATDPGFLREIIERHILPRIDFPLMSKLVLGKHWRAADDGQREAFMNAFRERLIRTYSTPLSEYEGQKINFLPFHPGSDPKRATVETEIVPLKGVPIPVTYKLHLDDEAGWKVYDIAIDAVSMVGNYRSAFGQEISRQGLAEFMSSLSRKPQ